MVNKHDPGFGKTIEWDIPLLEGYDSCFVKNTATKPGSHHFRGIVNPGLIAAIESYGADAVLVYGWAFTSHLKVMRHFYKKIPVLFRGDSISLIGGNLLKNKIRQLFLKWVYTYVEEALYVGTHNKNYFLQKGIQETHLHFAPHAIDNDRFLNNHIVQQAAALAWRKELGIMPNALVFLYAGKLDTNKNTRLLLESFLAEMGLDSQLLIAGNGVLEDSLKMDFEAKPNIHFLPFQNQQKMPVLYRMADVFVLPSLSETWGLSINEAMVCECALLVSKKAGAAIDLVVECKNGLSFDPKNQAELREKLSFMMQHKDLVKKWGTYSGGLIPDWNYTKTCLVIEKLVNQIKG